MSIDVYCQQYYNIITVRNSPLGNMKGSMTMIMLIPLKLLAKAFLYLLAAIFGALGFILTLASSILQRIGFFVGGLSILAAIIMWAMVDGKIALTTALMGAASIFVPVIAMFISSGIILIKEKLLDVSADIELIS